MKILLSYLSYGGNTEEVADLIEMHLLNDGHEVTKYRVGTGSIPDPRDFDIFVVGSFTYHKGDTPEEMKDFVYDIGYKPPHVYVFGTGDTQFGGDELFCRAAERLARFYESPYPPLKIEQSPRGSQEPLIKEWTEGVLRQCLVF